METIMTKYKKGFTIIEVVLVLAVAGLIFAMIFIAFPALQRYQRDTQRKSDLSRLKSAYQTYKSNNKNQDIKDIDYGAGMPVWNKFLNDYLRVGNEPFSDPSGKDYRIEEGPWYTEGRSQHPGDGVISLNYKTQCGQGVDGRSVIVDDGYLGYGLAPWDLGPRITVRLKLESGGVACLDLNN